eukprot:Polyplicarium_translucidae@DN3216_c0_g1_i6.p3
MFLSTKVVPRKLFPRRSSGAPIPKVELPVFRLLASDEYYRDVYRRLINIRHPNLVEIHEVDEDNDSFRLLMDRCRGQDLVDHVLSLVPRRVNVSDCKRIMFQLLSAVQCVHSNLLLHRDIKLDNIMFRDATNTDIVLIDFDMCMLLDRHDVPRPMANPKEVCVVGTREYMAPECFKGEYSTASDVWSCGIVWHVLIHGVFPFDIKCGDSHQAIRSQHRRRCREGFIRGAPDSAAGNLLQAMLTYSSSRRLQTPLEALTSAWFFPVPREWRHISRKECRRTCAQPQEVVASQ